jgi:hypothetical protein
MSKKLFDNKLFLQMPYCKQMNITDRRRKINNRPIDDIAERLGKQTNPFKKHMITSLN